MISNRRLLALAVAGSVAAAPLAGCGAGRSPQTAMPTRLTEGVNASVPQNAARPQLDIRNLFVLGPAVGASVAAGGSVPLYGTLINQVADRGDSLVRVSSPSFRQAQLAAGGVQLPAATAAGGQAVQLAALPTQPGQPAQPPGAQQPPRVVLQGLAAPLQGGENLRLTLEFRQAGSITLTVPVITHQNEYATYAAVPTATPTTPAGPTAGATRGPARPPSPKPSPTGPSASPS